ncbi:MAG: hypothetical protein JXQ99_29320 [Hyphomicrobiaceae bacterium]
MLKGAGPSGQLRAIHQMLRICVLDLEPMLPNLFRDRFCLGRIFSPFQIIEQLIQHRLVPKRFGFSLACRQAEKQTKNPTQGCRPRTHVAPPSSTSSSAPDLHQIDTLFRLYNCDRASRA